MTRVMANQMLEPMMEAEPAPEVWREAVMAAASTVPARPSDGMQKQAAAIVICASCARYAPLLKSRCDAIDGRTQQKTNPGMSRLMQMKPPSFMSNEYSIVWVSTTAASP